MLFIPNIYLPNHFYISPKEFDGLSTMKLDERRRKRKADADGTVEFNWVCYCSFSKGSVRIDTPLHKNILGVFFLPDSASPRIPILVLVVPLRTRVRYFDSASG